MMTQAAVHEVQQPACNKRSESGDMAVTLAIRNASVITSGNVNPESLLHLMRTLAPPTCLPCYVFSDKSALKLLANLEN